ncbi:MAG: ArsR family transcriptional regulator [Kiritimatiellaeota bacterium]|nr:ArsR family transcriptional regulator [Kiritimatiellota bacterium]
MEISCKSQELKKIAGALRGKSRLRILELLAAGPLSVTEIARQLKMPLSTASVNLNLLGRAGLIKLVARVTTGKYNKICALAEKEIRILLPQAGPASESRVHTYSVDIPIGQYTDCSVTPTCGIVSDKKIIGTLDNPDAFWDPERVHAGMLWFSDGFVEYRIPGKFPRKAQQPVLEIAMEIGSEYPYYKNDWPSDITTWINGVEIGTWTAPGDLGGQRGKLNPKWWPSKNSQYGLLKVWRVTDSGTFIDGDRISGTTTNDLKLMAGKSVPLRIGIKPKARRKGGLNIFGKSFGNYPQDIVVKFEYLER